MGRDQLFDLSGFHGLLIRRRKRMVKTTNLTTGLRSTLDLIKDLVVDGPEQLWVSDMDLPRA